MEEDVAGQVAVDQTARLVHRAKRGEDVVEAVERLAVPGDAVAGRPRLDARRDRPGGGMPASAAWKRSPTAMMSSQRPGSCAALDVRRHAVQPSTIRGTRPGHAEAVLPDRGRGRPPARRSRPARGRAASARASPHAPGPAGASREQHRLATGLEGVEDGFRAAAPRRLSITDTARGSDPGTCPPKPGSPPLRSNDGRDDAGDVPRRPESGPAGGRADDRRAAARDRRRGLRKDARAHAPHRASARRGRARSRPRSSRSPSRTRPPRRCASASRISSARPRAPAG